MIAFFIQWLFNKRIVQRNVIVFLRHLIQDVERVCGKIEDSFQKSGEKTLWNELLNQIQNDLMLYDRNQEYMILQSKLPGRDELFDWFSRLRTNVNTSLGTNSMLWEQRGKAEIVAWGISENKKRVAEFASLRLEAKGLREKLK